MIEIYFDGTLIDTDNYAEIKNEFKLFDDTFKLGSVSANTFNISLPFSSFDNIPNIVTININNDIFATLIIDSYEMDDNNIVKFNLIDAMIKFNFNYDASMLIEQRQELGQVTTTKDILDDICDKTGVTLGTEEFVNDDVIVDYYDNTITAREYISYIAETNGGYAQIGRDGKLYLRRFNNEPINIDINECESIKIKERHIIERVVFDNGLEKYVRTLDDIEDSEELETLYLNSNNVYITNEEIFGNIANEVLGLIYYCLEVKNSPFVNCNAGELINYTDGINNYVTIAQYNLEYFGSFYGDYSLEINSKQQEETKQINNTDEKIKALKIRVDRNANEIEQRATLIDIANDKINEVIETLTANEKRIDVISKNIDSETGDVREIKTITGFSFDATGLHIKNSETKFNTEITNTGTYYKDDAVIISSTTKDGFDATKIKNKGIYEYGYDNDEFLFVDELIEVDNEKALATFYCGGD